MDAATTAALRGHGPAGMPAMPGPLAGTGTGPGKGIDPGPGLAAAASEFMAVLDRHEGTARAAMTGGADPHALVEALASSQLAIETVATLRDRVVEAYQEILRMPI